MTACGFTPFARLSATIGLRYTLAETPLAAGVAKSGEGKASGSEQRYSLHEQLQPRLSYSIHSDHTLSLSC